MQTFNQKTTIQASLYECFQQWVALDQYPRFRFSKVPQPSEHWSSADAWGENCISGSRHLDWSLASYPGSPQKQVNWRIQDCLKGHLIQFSGTVTFEAQGQHTGVIIQMNWNVDGNDIVAEDPEYVLQSCLRDFKVLAEKISGRRALKIAV